MAQSAAAQALGAYIHHYNADFNRGADAVGDAFSKAVAGVPDAIGSNVGGFVHGLMTGQSPQAPTPAKGGKAAAPAAPAPGGPKAPVYTQAQLDAAPNFVQQAAAAAAAQAGGKQANNASAAAPVAPPTPLDVIRAAAMNNGGLSLAQLGALSESVARTVPQATRPVPQTAKELATQRYTSLNEDYAQRVMQDPNYANSQLGAAQRSLIESYRPVVGQPNPIGDVYTAQQLGMPGN